MADDALRYCTRCGKRLQARAAFCAACGAPARGQAVPAQPLRLKASPAGLVVALLFVAAGSAALLSQLGEAPAPARAVPGSPAGRAEALPENVPAGHPSVELPAEMVKIIDDLRRTAEQAPDDVEAWTKFARAAYRAGRLDRRYMAEAEKAFAHLIELDPDNLEAIRGQGNAAYERRDYAAAEAAYRRYLELDPKHVGVATDLGSALLFQGKLDEAVSTYRKVLEQDPDFVPAHVNLGIALHGAGRVEEAESEFEKALSLAKSPEEKAEVRRIIEAARSVAARSKESGAAGAHAETNATSEFQKAADELLTSQPIFGQRIARIDWTGPSAARVLVSDFPMEQMPEVMRNKFKANLNGALSSLAADHGVGSPISVELVDATTGRVLERLDGKEMVGAFDESKYQ